jgi:hypothetical protein
VVFHRSDTNEGLRVARRSAAALVALCAVCCAPAVRAADTTAVTFAAQQTVATGTAPHSVELADLNADGKLDLIVTNQGDGTVSVLLNTTAAGATTPTFAAQQTLATGSGPAAAIAADINGDGKPDIVVANAQSATVSILFNDTAAAAATVTFTAQQTFPTAQYPFDIAATDLDGDGKLDLIVANAGSTVVSVLRNTTAAATTTASFVTQSLVPVGTQPAAVAVADFNEDGHPDFVVVNFLDNTVSLLLNTTAAGGDTLTFADQIVLPTGTAPSAIAVADINADGKPDIVTGDAFENSVSVLLNTSVAGAAPTFAARKAFITGIGPAAVTIADINGDGRPDLVVPEQAEKIVSVFVNTTAFGGTTPAFAARQNFTTGTAPVAAAVADLNGDGKPDIIAANYLDKTLSLLLNTSAFDGINLNQHGLTGSWFNPAASGQGIELELYPDFGASGQGIVFGGWFTFDVTAAGGQRWYALQGAISSSNPTAQLGIYAGYGGNFAAPPAIGATQVGSATLRFTTCNTGILTYQFDDGRSGTIALARLTANITCSANGDNGAAASSYLLSGSWFDASTSGQGLVFDINPAQSVFFAGWYTYAPDGAQTGGAASERWYVIQADFPAGTTAITGAPIYAGSGGVFDDPQPTSVSQVGTADIAFQSCAAATLAYTFTAGVNAGLTGTLNLTRTGPVPAGCSLAP